MNNRPCSMCGDVRDGAHQSYCKTCLAAYVAEKRREKREETNTYQREYRHKQPPEKRAAYRRKRYLLDRYGMTVEDFNDLYDKQNGCCAICETSLPRQGTDTCIDHCHDTGKVRGMLCVRCNTGIGHLRHNPEIIRAAVDYLRNHMEVI